MVGKTLHNALVTAGRMTPGDNVLVQGVAGDVNAIGYFGYAYYAENTAKLKALPIVEKEGKPAVAPSEKTVLDGSYQPLSRPIFIYVNAKSLSKPEVKKFVDFYMTEGGKMASEVKYVPLPAEAYKLAQDHIIKGKKGTVFGGKNEVGITIKELLGRMQHYQLEVGHPSLRVSMHLHGARSVWNAYAERCRIRPRWQLRYRCGRVELDVRPRGAAVRGDARGARIG